MSQNYNFKSLQIADSDKKEEKEQGQSSDTLTVFETGDTRTIDFISLDGTRQNFAYAHYMTAWLGTDKESENNERYIKIFFATHLVTIKGYCLDGLYNELIKLNVKSVKAQDERYADMVDDAAVFVTGIKVEWKKNQ